METCIFTYFRVGPAFELMNIGECNGTGVLVHLGSTTMHSYNPRLLGNCPLRDISYEYSTGSYAELCQGIFCATRKTGFHGR